MHGENTMHQSIKKLKEGVTRKETRVREKEVRLWRASCQMFRFQRLKQRSMRSQGKNLNMSDTWLNLYFNQSLCLSVDSGMEGDDRQAIIQ